MKEKMGHLDEAVMREIDNAIAVSLGLVPHGTRLPAVTAEPVRRTAAAAAAATPPKTEGVAVPKAE